ncbi:M24 family metallopeptidase [Haloferula sp.]|uniref:M24 family metallopeptidase n=1 Tax=Haloferula sp. TaxID=2497595 RepID=UPI00329C0954
MEERLAAIRQWMASNEWDALLVTAPANVRYASGFRGEPGTLWIDTQHARLMTSFRSERWAREQTSTFEVVCADDPIDSITSLQHAPGLRIGVDRMIPYTTLSSLRSKWTAHSIEPVSGIETLRQVKSEAEVDRLRHSQTVNERIFDQVIPKIRPGISERAAQGLILAAMAADEEIDGPSFTPIVAAGGNAWEIHHQPDDTILAKGDMVIIDLGVRVAGYASDMTRTVCLGQASERMRNIHATVREAQLAAFETIRHGVSAREADAAARKVIDDAGHGRTFTHGLGHGIGLETHDAHLRMSPSAEDVTLQSGMAVTVEPGIYLEDEFGVRTEDIVIVRPDGIENLTTTTHELIEIPV